jgi:hypothetical protein
LIALAVSYAVKTGVRNVTYGACALNVFLTAIGKIIADVLFFTKAIAADEQVPASMSLATSVLRDLWTLKWGFSGFVAVFDGAIVLAAALIIWGMRPNFSVAFKVVSLPGNPPQVATAKA